MGVVPAVDLSDVGRSARTRGVAVDVLEAIDERARRAPAAVALVDPTGELTYAELVAEVTELAGTLVGAGVSGGDLIGLCLGRGRTAVVAMLAVLRAGAGYVPLDPGYPPARLALMVEDVRPRLVLVPADVDPPPLPEGTEVLRIGEPGPPSGTAAPATRATAEDPAYVIFTSGSTGRPKGVMVPRPALHHFCAAARDRYALTPADRVLQFASLSFDASVEEIFPPLTAGATVVVRDEDMISRPDLFLDRCAALGVTVLDLPTAYWHELVVALDRGEAELPATVRLVIIGGEAAQAGAVRDWQARTGPAVRLLNTYGPTETTVVATVADLTGWNGDGPVPIGHPLPGVTVRVLDPSGKPVVVGDPGELVIGGAGVATGYLRRPDLTAERFVPGPDGAPEYRTGDRVRQLADGELVYLGRFDHQVKIRGFRVELGEVESALRALPGITDAVVLVDGRSGQPRLVGHLTAAEGAVDPVTVRRQLAATLPAHLVPAAIVGHARFPLTPQGKVDRAALGAVPVAMTATGADPAAAPGDPFVARVGGLWADLLGVTDVATTDDLFALGADSLDAIRLTSALRREYGVDLTLAQLYAAPTLAELVALLRSTGTPTTGPDPASNGTPDPVASTDEPEPEPFELPLSPLQRDFWIAEQVSGELPAHTLGIRYRMAGPVSAGTIAACLAELARRHPLLRARFPLDGDEPRMVIVPDATVELTEVDLRDLPTDLRESRLEQARRQAVREPVDLADGPLARALLLRTGGDDELLLVVHHLVFDGWSVGVLGDELARLHRDLSAGRTPAPTPPRPLPDLAARRLAHAADETLTGYWRDRFADADLDLELPADRPRPPVRSFAAGRVARQLDPELVDRLRRCGRAHRASLFMVVLAGLQSVLLRYTGRTDVTVLAPVAGRTEPDLESLVGPVLNILPMRGDVGGEPTFAELVERVRDAVVRDLDHQELSLPDIIAATRRPASGNRNRLSGVMLTVHNTPVPGTDPVRYAGEVAPAATMVDLAVGLDFPVDGPVLSVDYATELFDAERVEALLDHLLTLLAAGVEGPSTPVTRLDLLTPAERTRILHDWNDHAAPVPAANGLHELFERCAAATPAAPALTYGDTTISYRQLNERANRLARLLRERGVRPGGRVAICLDRGIELFVAMWAVLKAGGAYVPLDPAYPPDRLRYMLTDSRALALVTRLDLAGAPQAPDGVAVLALDRDAATIDVLDHTDPPGVNVPDDPAYVIYTSGSTGRAKGVVVNHGNLVHAAVMWQRAYRLDPGWTYQQAASFSFDMFVGETLRAHCTGGRLVVVPREVLLDPADLYALMRDEQVNCTELVPAVLRTLLAHVEASGQRLDFVRLLIGGGEKWHVREYQQARRLVGVGNRVVNAYGVTEVTVDNVYFDGDVDGLPPDAPLPIGQPFPNNRVYVLDAYGQPVPAGVVGELYLGGVGVAPGYHDRPELTAERFVPDPYADAPSGVDRDAAGLTGGMTESARMYRTGDAARFHRNGNVDFLGRLDDQVKINGYRVELGEVEAVMGTLDGVLACAAAVHQLPSGIAQLVGYLVARPGAEVTEADVRDALAASLPVHMVPARVVELPRLPLTPNGKLDRRALPAPPAAGTATGGTAPRTPTERRLVAVWAETLGVTGIGIDDTFFSLGGDSFTALRLVRRIEPAPTLIELYQHPTVRTLAALLDRRPAEPAGGPDRLLHRMTPNDADPATGGVTVVGVPYSGGSAIAYQPLAAALPANWALYALELPGHDQSRPDEALLPGTEVAALVLPEIEALTGPVLLYGHCLGVAVTMEIARRAEAAGVELIGVGLGAGFPTARLPGRFFDWFYRLVPTDRFTSDREYLSYLRGRGGFTDLDRPEDEAFVLRNVRHDARDAEEYFTADYRGAEPTRLRAPVLAVVGARDRVTEHYQERHREWEHFATEVDLAVLPKAGHFFVRSHPEPLARVLVERARQWLRRTGSEPAAADPAPAAAETAPKTEVVPAPAVPAVRRRPSPSLSRFALVAFGQFVSMIGSGLSTLVLSIWVYQQTGAITDFAVVSAVGMLPGILVGPVAGAVADRWDRRRVMLASDAAAALAMGTLGLAVLGGGLELWQVYLAVSVTSVAGAFQRPAYLAAVAQLVPKRYLGHANGISQLGVNFGLVFAPMLGAGLIGLIGISGVILLDVLTFCVGVSTLIFVRFPDLMFRRREETFRREVANGWRYIARRPGLRAALRFFVIDHALYTLGFAVITPMLLIEQSPMALGAALSAGGLGGLCGSLLMGLWGGTARRANGVIIFMGLASLAMAIVGVGASPVFAVIGMFLLTFGESVTEGHWIALIQTKVGFELQGRVLSIFITVMMLTMPLGYLVVGPLADHYVQPLLEPGGGLADTVGALIGTGPGRGLALLVIVSGLLQLGWAVRGWFNRPLRLIEDHLPDAVPPAEIGDRDTLQREADELLLATRN
ncbi:non-ribosomal peptide synthetase/MFS transporter [Micromonospora sp. NBC_01796]|uniref:non-ribosomal peptide synthetase/MFS transporter n=1 Tax=Micromonospora sp. NBC_01796 TaxID=2975987 RepID=UPI002DD948BF|nr:non-ribosomal peptide synthetase [Micromonospora sp. NBC_01796]WSA84455.1 amino acid adenylation domain-containing protein [Micromonospora sp. NBC_01796]